MGNSARDLLALESDKIERARTRMLAFTQFTKPDYRVNWHHRLICKYLNRFISGDIRRLMIFCPPRHGKSELVSRRLPALLLGRNPDAQIISASYSDSLASMMNRDTQRIIESPEYRLLFPATSLSKAAGSQLFTRNSDTFEVVGHRGRYKSAGIGTGITGMGANYAIIDDPVKDQVEADSELKREKVWEWYTSTLYTRLQNPRSILLTMTRWHRDDLAGRLLDLAQNDPNADQWVVLCLPAQCTGDYPEIDQRQPGEPLWPEDFSLAALQSIQASVGPRVWSALYQQSPRPAGGGAFSEEMFEFAEIPKADELDYTFIMADTAYKDKETNDFHVFTAFGVKGDKLFVIDVFRKRMKASEVEAPAEIFIKKYQTYSFRGAYIEPKGHGIYLNDVLPKKGIRIPPESMRNEFFKDRRLGKIERANNAIPHLTNRKVYINKDLPNKDELVNEALSFPLAKHDDFVDTLVDGIKFTYSKTISILDVL